MASLEDVTKELKQLNADSLSAGDVVKYINAAGEEREAVFVEILESLNEQGKTMIQLQSDNATFAIQDQQLLVEENNSLEGILKELNKNIAGLVQFLKFEQKQEGREESTEPGGKGKPSKEGVGLKGAFAAGMQKGEEEQLGIMKTIEEFSEGMGMWAGKFKKVFGILRVATLGMFTFVSDMVMNLASRMIAFARGNAVIMKIVGVISKGMMAVRVGMMALLSGVSGIITSVIAAITPAIVALAPFIAIAAAIAAGIAALVMGIQGFIDKFQSQEGSLFDKITAGLAGFATGMLKVLTIPLDWIKDLFSSVLEFFGFDGAAEVLDSFSFTDLMDSFGDTLVEFIIGIKDSIIEGLKNVGKKILGFFGFGGDEEEEVDTKRGKEIPGNEAGEGATGLKEADDYFKTERVETEGRIDGTAVLSGRSDNPDIADEGVTKADVMKYSDQGMAPREAIAAANAESRAKQDAQAAAPTPKKLTIPEGVRVTPFGSYASYNKFTNSQAQFDNVEDAIKFKDAPIEEAAKMDDYAAEIYNKRKQLDAERQERVEKLKARRDAKEEESSSPVKTAVGTVAEALSPAVVNKGTEILTKAGVDDQTALTISRAGADMATEAATTLVGGGEIAAQGDMLQQAQDRLSSKKAEGGANTANIVTTNNSTNASVVNNTTVSQGMPKSTNEGTRSHYRGRR